MNNGEVRIKFLPGPHTQYFERIRPNTLFWFHEDLGRGRCGAEISIRLSHRPSVSPGQSVTHDKGCRPCTEWTLMGQDEETARSYMLLVAEDGCGIAYPDDDQAF